MTRRKGEIDRAQLRRHWPHHVAISADKVRGRAWLCGRSLSGAADVFHSPDDGDFVVFCFAKAEDAAAFLSASVGSGYRSSHR